MFLPRPTASRTQSPTRTRSVVPLPSQQSRTRYRHDDFVRPGDEVVEQQDLRSASEEEAPEQTDTDSDYDPNIGRLNARRYYRTAPLTGGGDSDSEQEQGQRSRGQGRQRFDRILD
ncbi:hypothetical protein KC333_g1478 [Hortaea werneckii]|nr:hypothetical protein KC333_g1478 [Hortaea werneckii]KAI7320223.1 hypothetical protein KC326_g2740 [Hortaea werneckii]